MRTYSQYCPIARGAEIFAERWTPIIMRNILMGCETFTEIQRGAPGIPRSLLTQRLAVLERHGILERCPNANGRGARYRPTEAGKALGAVCFALGEWGTRWLDVAPDHVDAYMVVWSMCSNLAVDRVPDQRLVIRFELRGQPKKRSRFWMLIEHGQGEVCVMSPGEEDLLVTADVERLSRWQTGHLVWADAVADGSIVIEGERQLARRFPSWNRPGPFAHISMKGAVSP